MVTSANIQERIIDFLSDQENHSVQEIKMFLEQCKVSDYTEGQFAGSINTLLRNGTIQKIDRGIYALKVREKDMKKCFVVSPIGADGDEIRKKADKVFKYVIKPVCDACEFEAIRVDQLNDANCINQTVIDYLDTADLVIADMTGHNPNVFYEMGYRTRTKKPMIQLKEKGESIPFDVTTIRTLEYDLTDLDNVEEVKDRLKRTIESFAYLDSSDISTEDESCDGVSSPVLPILYQILDTMNELKLEVKSFSTETIGTVVRSMQSSQPQVSPDTALQMQLISGFMQNPESFARLIELSEKINVKSK